MAELPSTPPGSMSGADESVLNVRERKDLSLLTLRGIADDPAFAEAVAGVAAPLPRVPNTASRAASTAILWLAPDAWLVVAEDVACAQRLATSVSAVGGYVLDTSHARVVSRVEGAGARTALAQVCRLDLHPRNFAVDACAQTRLAHISALVHRVAEDTFDLYVPRSYARHLNLFGQNLGLGT